MTTKPTPKSDKELWQSLAEERDVTLAAVSDLDFAAWLEGRLPEAAAARVDAAVAADPELRRAALELADILGKPVPAAPARMAVRAQALVGFEAERRVRRGNWLGALLPSFGGSFSLQRVGMAGLAIMMAAVGFLMGGGLGESYAHEKHAKTTATKPLGIDTTNELNDLFNNNT
jgi:hypothetical protein